MKTEDGVQAPQQPQAQQPPPPQQPTTTTFSAAQWGSQIPIDPALQQQSQPQTQPQQHATTPQYSHYQAYQQYQHSYSHYQYAPQATQQTQMATLPAAPAKPAAAPTPATSALDTTDVTKLNDALGSAGVDLRAEEESLHRTFDQYQSYRPYEDRSRKQPPRPSFDTRILGTRIRDIGTQHKVTKVPEESVNYLALALRARLQDVVEAMIEASTHRTDTQFDRPPSQYEDGTSMWRILVRADVSKQLATIERVEREEETKIRRERKERSEMAAAHAAALAAQASGSNMVVDGEMEDGQPKKKKKKADGPGVTARNMSEDVRKKMSNAVASQAAGLGTKYAWMNASAAAAPAAKAKAAAAPAPAAPSALTPATTTTPAASAGNASTWARPYVLSKSSQQNSTTPESDDKRRPITLRDAMFVIEKEKGHGGGRGAARGWT